MIVLVVLGLILLIAIFAVGFTVGSGRRGLAPASNHSIPAKRRVGRVFNSAGKSNQTGSSGAVQSQTTATNNSVSQPFALDVSVKQEKTSPTFSPVTNKPIIIAPNNEKITIKPSSVIKVKPTANPRETIVVKPQEPVLIKQRETIVVKPSLVMPIAVEPSQATTVKPPERGVWDERGWTKNINGKEETYEGFYRVGARQFHGRIIAKNRGSDIFAYIYNPPREIKRHKHHACFQQARDGWFSLHWARPARNVDDAILYMERVLDESLNR